MRFSTLSLAASLAILMMATAEAQSIWYVDQGANGANNGTSWTDAFNDLQDGLAAAGAGDSVWVAAGLYPPDSGTGDPARSFQIEDGVAVYGGFAGGESSLEERDWQANVTILSGDLARNDGAGFANYDENSVNVVQALASVSDDITAGRLDGFTVTGGNGSGGGIFCSEGRATVVNCAIERNLGFLGGGVYCYLSDITISDCTIDGNAAAEDGGGLYLYSSNPVIERSILTGNEAGWGHAGPFRGGAIECTAGSRPALRNCEITLNSADWWGGGISVSSGGHPDISGCVISHNDCEYFGGGIGCDLCSVTVSDTIISSNSAGWYGGGITCFTSSADLSNCLVTDNSAGANGGGVHALERSTLSLVNCTITHNSAGGPGGGLATSDILTEAVLINCVLWEDNPGEIDATSGSIVNATYSDIEGGRTGEGNIDADPVFVDAAGADYHITATSACREAGNPNAPGVPALDFEGDERPADGTVEIGADEFHSHLYSMGQAVPGATVVVRVIGDPANRALLALGSGVRADPRQTPYGPLYLELPILLILDLGSIPETGVLELPLRIPINSQPGQTFPFQALVGAELTNLMVIEVAE